MNSNTDKILQLEQLEIIFLLSLDRSYSENSEDPDKLTYGKPDDQDLQCPLCM